MDCTLGLTLWNLSCFRFKFDDTRYSYWHQNKIGRIDFFQNICLQTWIQPWKKTYRAMSRHFVHLRLFLPVCKASFCYQSWVEPHNVHSSEDVPLMIYVCIQLVCTLGLTLWNLSSLEFKFDDTRYSYWHKNKISRIENNVVNLLLSFLIF